MKKTIFTLVIITSLLAGCNQGPATYNQQITATITQFIKAGDARDVATLDNLLHPEYRAIMNRLFGSEDVGTISKSDYLGLIKDGTIGGDTRQINIVDVDVVNQNARAKAIQNAHDWIFTSYFLLAENVEGNWKILSDMSHLEKVE